MNLDAVLPDFSSLPPEMVLERVMSVRAARRRRQEEQGARLTKKVLAASRKIQALASGMTKEELAALLRDAE